MCQFSSKRQPPCGICVKLKSILKIHLNKCHSSSRLKIRKRTTHSLRKYPESSLTSNEEFLPLVKPDPDSRSYLVNNVRFDSKIKDGKNHSLNDIASTFQCAVCNTSFGTYESLINHSKIHSIDSKPAPHTCNTCGKSFKKKNNLSRHLRSNICGAFSHDFYKDQVIFGSNVEDATNHPSKNQTSIFQCTICSTSFDTNEALTDNSQMHNNNSKAVYHTCNICGKIFKRKFNLTRHLRSNVCAELLPDFNKEHSANEKTHGNPQTATENTGFSPKQELQSKAKGLKPYRCSHCSSRFSSAKSRKAHIKNLHPQVSGEIAEEKHKNLQLLITTEDSRTDKEVDISPNFATNANEQNKVVKEEDPKEHFEETKRKEYPYECAHCKHLFKTDIDFSEHLQVSAAHDKLTCEVCEKMFVSDACLKHHLLSHDEQCPFICHICAKSFKSQSILMQHRQSHVPKTHICQECGAALSSLQLLHEHVQEYHAENLFTCLCCEKTFSARLGLQEHIRSTAACWRFSCDICKIVLPKDTNAWQHVQQHTETMEHAVACAYQNCCKRFPNEKYRSIHWRLHFTETETRGLHMCEYCPQVFHTTYARYKHIVSHNIGRPFKCHICERAFQTAGFLQRHLAIHEESSFICEICGENMATKNRLISHHRQAHGERQYKCDECPAAFLRRPGLVKHKLIHAGIRPYTCEHCGKRFTEKTNLNVHIRIHTGVKPYACPICDYRCVQSPSLKKHMLMHTGEHKYHCEECDRRFKHKSHLMIHLKRHRGEKNHVCKTCGKAFVTPGSLRHHETVHSDRRPHQCQICGSVFKHQGSLRLHLRNHKRVKEPRGESNTRIVPKLETHVIYQL